MRIDSEVSDQLATALAQRFGVDTRVLVWRECAATVEVYRCIVALDVGDPRGLLKLSPALSVVHVESLNTIDELADVLDARCRDGFESKLGRRLQAAMHGEKR